MVDYHAATNDYYTMIVDAINAYMHAVETEEIYSVPPTEWWDYE